MHTNKFIYEVSCCIEMLSHVTAFYVDPSYEGKEKAREEFIRDYFNMAKDYMQYAKEHFNDKK